MGKKFLLENKGLWISVVWKVEKIEMCVQSILPLTFVGQSISTFRNSKFKLFPFLVFIYCGGRGHGLCT